MERELSQLVVARFPHMRPPLPAAAAADAGPSLLGLAELERSRDGLAARLQELRGLAAQRTEREQAAREQLERMRLEPGRYRFARVSVRDLGEGTCGFWEVRPRFGLIGMLAGWWQLKLSSGCPLAGGSRRWRDPGRHRTSAQTRVRLSFSQGVAPHA
jgi:hypothetical protein